MTSASLRTLWLSQSLLCCRQLLGASSKAGVMTLAGDTICICSELLLHQLVSLPGLARRDTECDHHCVNRPTVVLMQLGMQQASELQDGQTLVLLVSRHLRSAQTLCS